MSAALQTHRPSFFWLLSEPSRALTELGLSFSFNSFSKPEPNGDGHPVMILPGFMGSKYSTKVLRDFVGKLGYKVYDWGMGRNLGKDVVGLPNLHQRFIDDIFYFDFTSF